jgi:hypothetical protein
MGQASHQGCEMTKIRINYPNLIASMTPEDRVIVLRCAAQLEEKLELSHRDSLELLAKIGEYLQNGHSKNMPQELKEG